MNPSLLLCLIICPLALMGAISLFHFNQAVPASLLLAIAGFPMLITGWQLIKFTNTDPNRLQRDDHVREMFHLQHTIGVKGEKGVRTITAAGELAGNPALEDRSGE